MNKRNKLYIVACVLIIIVLLVFAIIIKYTDEAGKNNLKDNEIVDENNKVNNRLNVEETNEIISVEKDTQKSKDDDNTDQTKKITDTSNNNVTPNSNISTNKGIVNKNNKTNNSTNTQQNKNSINSDTKNNTSNSNKTNNNQILEQQKDPNAVDTNHILYSHHHGEITKTTRNECNQLGFDKQATDENIKSFSCVEVYANGGHVLGYYLELHY